MVAPAIAANVVRVVDPGHAPLRRSGGAKLAASDRPGVAAFVLAFGGAIAADSMLGLMLDRRRI